MAEYVEVTISLDADLFDFYKAQLDDVKKHGLEIDDDAFNVFLEQEITVEKHIEVVLSMNALGQIYE